MASNLDTILNQDCDCPEAVAVAPTPCPDTQDVTFPTPSIHVDECGSCEDEIIQAPRVVPDIEINKTCLSADPAYGFISAIDCLAGKAHYFLAVHPACVAAEQDCSFCIAPTCDGVYAPEDVGLTKRYGDDDIYRITVDGAAKPLLFHVYGTCKDLVNTQRGYIKVGVANTPNIWYPADMIECQYDISNTVRFPAGLTAFLNEVSSIGTIPTIATVSPVTSVLDDPVDGDGDADVTPPVVSGVLDQSSASGVAITDVQLVSDESPVTWSAVGLPAGLTLDPATGVISGTPTTVATPVPVTVTATDAAGNVSLDVTFTWEIT